MDMASRPLSNQQEVEIVRWWDDVAGQIDLN